ncbi:hypothetical protein GRI44_09735 [Altererythrobacter confluentis]|uniref:Uncharacterized protein n=1 Tax=Allopontixanthobacter confluentis TaxID=1849021 RepID=A0A6L7GGJ4_9SPHN|nr:hypothetical protein [Allopontixanthobacter confluentis]MXP15027.1 hypothetical protein [Allopontixanthobacter confluentis]
MLQKFNKFFTDLSAHVSLVALIVGSAAFAVGWGWAASASETIAAFGPLGWVTAATLGAGLFVLLAIGFAHARQRLVRTSIERQFFQSPERINPVDQEFTRKRIKFSDLASPITERVEGKRFVECEIIGPVNVVMLASHNGAGAIRNCELSSVCAILVKDGVPSINTLVLQDCEFIRCKIHQVTLLFPEEAYEWANERLPGLVWLTPAPHPRASS